MPIPPPTPSQPADTIDSVLNSVRTRMNDVIQSIGGDIITDNQPFTQEYTNNGWRRLQAFLANAGYSAYKKPLVLYAFPKVATADPASWTTLDWSFFFDGVSFYTSPAVGLFPSDFILPLRVSERITGSQSNWSKMEMAQDQLPAVRKGAYNGWWQWENSTLYMPGSVYSMDLRFEYASFLPDFLTVGETEWYQQTVPRQYKSSLSYYICAEAAGAREDMDADPFIVKAEQEARKIINVEISQRQRTPARRRCYGGGNRGLGQGFGYGGY